jgi:hypothetical protein
MQDARRNETRGWFVSEGMDRGSACTWVTETAMQRRFQGIVAM